MNPTAEDFEPRRDGWFEHRGTWQEVVVGTVIGSQKRTERWEVTDVSHGRQVEHGYTLWMRMRDQASGREVTVRPRLKTNPVTILTQDPADTETAEPTEPSDTEAIMTLVEKLGAEFLASKDNETGEVTCPDYATGHNHLDRAPGQLRAGMLQHLELAHDVEVPADATVEEVTTLHSRAHNPKFPSEGGFPHRHVPEDLTIYTGIRA